MTRDEIQKLIGGYATGSLTESEQKLLFDAALEDQELFDQLAHEQALKELLEVPGAKQRLLTALEPEKPSRAFWRNQLPWALAVTTASVIIVIGLVKLKTAERPVQIAAVTKPAEAPAPIILKDAAEADATAVPKASIASPAPATALREKRRADRSAPENTPVRQAEPTVVVSPPPPPPLAAESLKKETEAAAAISPDARKQAPPPQAPAPAALGFRADQVGLGQGTQSQAGQLQLGQVQQGQIQTAQVQERPVQQAQTQQGQQQVQTEQVQIQAPESRVLTLTPSAAKGAPGGAAGKGGAGGGGRAGGGGAFAAQNAAKAKAVAPFAFDYSFDAAGALRIVPTAQGFLSVTTPLQTPSAVLFPSRNVPPGTPVIVPIPAQASELVVSFSASPTAVTGVPARRDESSGTVQDQSPPDRRIQVTIPVKR